MKDYQGETIYRQNFEGHEINLVRGCHYIIHYDGHQIFTTFLKKEDSKYIFIDVKCDFYFTQDDLNNKDLIFELFEDDDE